MAEQKNGLPPLTPQEKEERIKELMEIMSTGKEIPQSIIVGLTKEQAEELNKPQNKFEICIERVLNKNEQILGRLDEEARKAVIEMTMIEMISSQQIPNTAEGVESAILKSLKEQGLKYIENRAKKRATSSSKINPEAWYSKSGVDLYSLSHSLISSANADFWRELHEYFPSEEMLIRAKLAEELINKIISDNLTEPDAIRLAEDAVKNASEQYSHILEEKSKVKNTDLQQRYLMRQDELLSMIRSRILAGGPYTSQISQNEQFLQEIASAVRARLSQNPPKSEEDYRQAVKEIVKQCTEPFLATGEDIKIYNRSNANRMPDTQKESAVESRFKNMLKKFVGGLAAALVLAGGIWFLGKGKEAGLEEKVSNTSLPNNEKPADYNNGHASNIQELTESQSSNGKLIDEDKEYAILDFSKEYSQKSEDNIQIAEPQTRGAENVESKETAKPYETISIETNDSQEMQIVLETLSQKNQAKQLSLNQITKLRKVGNELKNLREKVEGIREDYKHKIEKARGYNGTVTPVSE